MRPEHRSNKVFKLIQFFWSGKHLQRQMLDIRVNNKKRVVWNDSREGSR